MEWQVKFSVDKYYMIHVRQNSQSSIPERMGPVLNVTSQD